MGLQHAASTATVTANVTGIRATRTPIAPASAQHPFVGANCVGAVAGAVHTSLGGRGLTLGGLPGFEMLYGPASYVLPARQAACGVSPCVPIWVGVQRASPPPHP